MRTSIYALTSKATSFDSVRSYTRVLIPLQGKLLLVGNSQITHKVGDVIASNLTHCQVNLEKPSLSDSGGYQF